MITFRRQIFLMQNLILLHGALASGEQLQDLSSLLQDHFKVHIYEFDGHGTSSGSANPFQISNMAEDLEKYCLLHKIENTYLFGYSMGGYVALSHNLSYPLRAQKIVCLATKFDWNPESSHKEASILTSKNILTNFPGFASLLQQRHGANWEKVLEKTATMMKGLGERPLLNETNLPNVKADCLLLLGDKDHMVSVEETTSAANAIPNCNFIILENTIHPMEKVDSKKLATVLIQFFQT